MRKIIVANWKMNASLSLIDQLIPPLSACLVSSRHQIYLCPPFPYLTPLKKALRDLPVHLGAQNCHASSEGAFTGEVSAPMLADLGCEAVIVGHSERRTLFAETDSLVREKAAAVHKAAMIAIICIGETVEARNAGHAIEAVVAQLHASLSTSATPQNTMIAYEPIWAIGTGITPSEEDIIAMHTALRKALGNDIPLLYGGSVTDKNAAIILNFPHVNGVLVGGASLKIEMFEGIVRS
jgi:triosephosphate isomerase (TIM)